MSKIKIITDSTSDIPRELAEKYNITVVPLTVHFGEKEYKDWYDLTPIQFFEMLKTSDLMPTTSQITPIMFEEVFEEELKHYESIICITISSKASGTYQSAMIAKNSLENADVEVIDSMTFSYGYGMIAVEAAKMAQEGNSKDEIIKKIQYMLEHLDTYFIVDTLEYLKKGGRINLATAVIGNILNIKPVLAVKDGLVVPIGKIRGSKNVIPRMVKILKDKGYDLSDKVVGLAHGAMPEKLEELKKSFEEEFTVKAFTVSEVGSVIGAHAGPGVLGAFITRG